MDGERVDIVELSKREHASGSNNAASKGRRGLHLALVTIQVAFSGFEVLSRLALDHGAGKFSFTFYRNFLAFLVLAIAAVFLERKKLASLTFLDILKVFMLGLIGVTVNQLLYLAGLSYTSAGFASTLRNCIPLFTFLMALISRREKLDLRTKRGQAKLFGCALGVCGSVFLSLYRGPVLIRSSLSLIHGAGVQDLRLVDLKRKQYVRLFKFIRFEIASWTFGALCLIFSCLAFSSFLILQVPILHKHPAPISFASFCCLSSLVQIPLLAAIFEPKYWSRWNRISSSEALTIAYAGIVASGFVSAIQSWGVHRGGPVIVAAYQPLETVLTAFLGFIFLRESLHLGSLIGAIVVVIGLYLLIWGQEKERHTHKAREHSTNLRSKSFDISKVFPEPGTVTPPSCNSFETQKEEAPEAVIVADICKNSEKWRIYTVNTMLQEIEALEEEEPGP